MDFYHMTIGKIQKSDYPECFFMEKGKLTKTQMENTIKMLIANPNIDDEEKELKFNIFQDYFKRKLTIPQILELYPVTKSKVVKVLNDIIKALYFAQKDLKPGQEFNISNDVKDLQLTSLGLESIHFFRFTANNIRTINDICSFINSGKKITVLPNMGKRVIKMMMDCKNIYDNLPEKTKISILEELEEDKYK